MSQPDCALEANFLLLFASKQGAERVTNPLVYSTILRTEWPGPGGYRFLPIPTPPRGTDYLRGGSIKRIRGLPRPVFRFVCGAEQCAPSDVLPFAGTREWVDA